MKNLIRLTDYHAKEIADIFNITDKVEQGNYKDILKGNSVVLFFPNYTPKPKFSQQNSKSVRANSGFAVVHNIFIW